MGEEQTSDIFLSGISNLLENYIQAHASYVAIIGDSPQMLNLAPLSTRCIEVSGDQLRNKEVKIRIGGFESTPLKSVGSQV